MMIDGHVRILIKLKICMVRDYIKEIGEGLLCKPSLSYDKRLWLK